MKLKNNVALKLYRIKAFIGYMAAGHSDLAKLTFLDQTACQSKIVETTIHHYLKNVVQFLDYIAETLPPTCHLSRSGGNSAGGEVSDPLPEAEGRSL